MVKSWVYVAIYNVFETLLYAPVDVYIIIKQTTNKKGSSFFERVTNMIDGHNNIQTKNPTLRKIHNHVQSEGVFYFFRGMDLLLVNKFLKNTFFGDLSILHPFEVARSRLVVQERLKVSNAWASTDSVYTSTLDYLKQKIPEPVIANYLRFVSRDAGCRMLENVLRYFVDTILQHPTTSENMNVAIKSAIKCFVTYPLVVIKNRIQITDTIQIDDTFMYANKLVKKKGVKVLWRGFSVQLFRDVSSDVLRYNLGAM
ncbi:UCP1 [Acrasis kona]|uniref:UCP1 n=1 Tax=Acrasis kona TaxID=1008807 RepID=A0AAW2Z3V6_9EUKA